MEFHPLSDLEKKMKPETLAKARRIYEHDSLNLKLKAIREKYGVRQEDVPRFTQTAVSKLEKRKDIKLSTLIEYLDSLGMGLEIAALPKGKNKRKEILLRVG
jgi:transcriptional regulator with XRE-family HTH domain